MIQKKSIIWLLFVIAAVSSSINLMSSGDPSVYPALRAKLVEINTADFDNYSDAQVLALWDSVNTFAETIGPVHLSSISRNAGIGIEAAKNKIINAIISRVS